MLRHVYRAGSGGLFDKAAPQQGWMIMKTMMIMTLENGDLLDQKAAPLPPGLTMMMTTMPLTRTMVMIAIMIIIYLLRKWQIKTTQYTCESEMAPRKDCLQYHTAQYGRCQ